MKIRPKARRTNADRFWTKVKMAGPDECWTWIAAVASGGYGAFTFAHAAGHTQMGAHVVSYFLAHGTFPAKGKVVMHKCDNRRCVNPQHLSVGTARDNVTDCIAKGRSNRGEAQHLAKLNEHHVREIRRRAASGETQDALAREFGMSQQSISNIVLRVTWRHVA